MSKPLSRQQKKVLWIAALLAPTLAVQAARFLGDASVTQAPAAMPTSPDADGLPTTDQSPDARPPKPPTETQRRAMAFLSSARPLKQPRSPMDEPEVVSPPPATEVSVPASPPEPVKLDPPPNLVVTAIIGSKSRDMAMIGHRLHQVGDEVAPGWVITTIEAHNRLVRIQHQDGRTAEFSPQTGGR